MHTEVLPPWQPAKRRIRNDTLTTSGATHAMCEGTPNVREASATKGLCCFPGGGPRSCAAALLALHPPPRAVSSFRSSSQQAKLGFDGTCKHIVCGILAAIAKLPVGQRPKKAARAVGESTRALGVGQTMRPPGVKRSPFCLTILRVLRVCCAPMRGHLQCARCSSLGNAAGKDL